MLQLKFWLQLPVDVIKGIMNCIKSWFKHDINKNDFFYNGRKDYTDVYWHAQHKNIFLRLKYMFRSSSLLLFDLEALSFIYPCAITWKYYFFNAKPCVILTINAIVSGTNCSRPCTFCLKCLQTYCFHIQLESCLYIKCNLWSRKRYFLNNFCDLGEKCICSDRDQSLRL